MSYDFTEELAIKFVVDPNVSYRDLIDASHPAWQPDGYATSPQVAGAALADQPAKTPREVFDQRNRKYFVTAHQRFERALDPNGNICPVTTSSCRPSPEHPDGDDKLGTVYRVKGEKQEMGWLFVEPNASYMGLTGDKYLAWVFAVRDARRARYEAEQRANADDFQSKAMALIKEQAKSQGEMTGQMAKQISEALINALTTAGLTKNKKAGLTENKKGE